MILVLSTTKEEGKDLSSERKKTVFVEFLLLSVNVAQRNYLHRLSPVSLRLNSHQLCLFPNQGHAVDFLGMGASL